MSVKPESPPVTKRLTPDNWEKLCHTDMGDEEPIGNYCGAPPNAYHEWCAPINGVCPICQKQSCPVCDFLADVDNEIDP